MTYPEAEQDQEAPHQKHFDSDTAAARALRLDSDADTECEREQVEGLELHEFRHQQVDGMICPAGVRVEIENMVEQGKPEEIQQVDQQDAEERNTAQQVEYRVSLRRIDRLPVCAFVAGVHSRH